MSDYPDFGDRDWNAVLRARAWVDAIEIASRDPGVVKFRRDLPDGRVPRSNVVEWARSVEVDEGYTTLHQEVFLGDMPSVHLKDEEIPGFKPLVVPTKKKLLIEIGRDVFAAKADGTLGRLASISHRLAHQFGWSPALVALWVLTDQRPEDLARSIHAILDWGPDPKTKSWNLVTITAPAEIPSLLVGEVHRDMRAEAAKQHPNITLKGAPVGARQLSAMTFCVRRNDGRSWESMMVEWHEEKCKGRPNWRYWSFRNFARDVRDTYQRVMGRPWQHGGGVRNAEA